MLKTIKESTIRKIIKNKLLENYKRILLESNESNQNSQPNYTELFMKFVDEKWNKEYINDILKITYDELNSSEYTTALGFYGIDRVNTQNNNWIENNQKEKLRIAFKKAFKHLESYLYDADGINYLTDKSFPFDLDNKTLFQYDYIVFNKTKPVYLEFEKFINNEIQNSVANNTQQNNAADNQIVTAANQTVGNSSTDIQSQQNQTDVRNMTALFRIPQLNGGYFELAKILLDTNLMNQLQDISKGGYKPKQFEAQLLKTKGIKQYGFMNPADITVVHNVLIGSRDQQTSDNLKNPKILGKYLADFYMHQMFKVSQYIIISSHLLAYLVNRAKNDIQNAQKTFDICKEKGLNKVLKSNIDSNKVIADIQNAADSSNISLEKMFQGRADKNEKQINIKHKNKQNFDKDNALYSKNMNRMKSSARLAKTNPLQ